MFISQADWSELQKLVNEIHAAIVLKQDSKVVETLIRDCSTPPSARILHILEGNEIYTLEQLSQAKLRHIVLFKNCGKKAIAEIIHLAATQGITLKK